MQHPPLHPRSDTTTHRPYSRPDHRAGAARLAGVLLVVALGLLAGPLAALLALGLPVATALAVRSSTD